MQVFDSPSALLQSAGADLGFSDWIEVDQQRIDLFADATGDHQWIHVDPERAAQGPFGAPVAHGYLTLSMVAMMLPEVIRVENSPMGVNYGCNKVRFPSPVRVGSRLRAHGLLLQAEAVAGGVQAVVRATIEIEGGEKPACVAETIVRYYE